MSNWCHISPETPAELAGRLKEIRARKVDRPGSLKLDVRGPSRIDEHGFDFKVAPDWPRNGTPMRLRGTFAPLEAGSGTRIEARLTPDPEIWIFYFAFATTLAVMLGWGLWPVDRPVAMACVVASYVVFGLAGLLQIRSSRNWCRDRLPRLFAALTPQKSA